MRSGGKGMWGRRPALYKQNYKNPKTHEWFSNIRILFFKIFHWAIFIHNFAYLYFHTGLFRLRLCPFFTDVSFLSYTDFAAPVVRTHGPKCRPGLQKKMRNTCTVLPLNIICTGVGGKRRRLSGCHLGGVQSRPQTGNIILVIPLHLYSYEYISQTKQA